MREVGVLQDDLVIIDDDELMLELVKRSLRNSDVKLKCFSNEEVALAYLRTHKSRVLIVDQRMPRIEGLDLLKQLAEHACIEMTRVYLCSVAELPEKICEAARKLGAHTMLKDVYHGKGRLQKLLDGQRET